MIRIALSYKALLMVARIPDWPEADAVTVDTETGNSVLIYHDDKRKSINNARYAAANNKEFLLELANKFSGNSDDSTAVKVQRWAHWLRNGLVSFQATGRIQ
jgi:hypothetical protein